MLKKRGTAPVPFGNESTQGGVVLIIVLIMLGLLSLLASSSLRNAASTESIAGNGYQTELATQAAEIALRFCELRADSLTDTGDQWITITNWDGATSKPVILTLDWVNPSGPLRLSLRAPECMLKLLAGGDDPHYLITARGFGPEVSAADGSRSRPKGSEIWLQSTSHHLNGETKRLSWRSIFMR